MKKVPKKQKSTRKAKSTKNANKQEKRKDSKMHQKCKSFNIKGLERPEVVP